MITETGQTWLRNLFGATEDGGGAGMIEQFKRTADETRLEIIQQAAVCQKLRVDIKYLAARESAARDRLDGLLDGYDAVRRDLRDLEHEPQPLADDFQPRERVRVSREPGQCGCTISIGEHVVSVPAQGASDTIARYRLSREITGTKDEQGLGVFTSTYADADGCKFYLATEGIVIKLTPIDYLNDPMQDIATKQAQRIRCVREWVAATVHKTEYAEAPIEPECAEAEI